jgi:hypothetical protein
MNVSPETVVLIGGLASLLTQVLKRAIPGNIDAKGVEVNIVTSLAASSLWVYQYAPTMFSTAPFDAAVLWCGVVAASTGAYKMATMKTDTSKHSDQSPMNPRPAAMRRPGDEAA